MANQTSYCTSYILFARNLKKYVIEIINIQLLELFICLLCQAHSIREHLTVTPCDSIYGIWHTAQGNLCTRNREETNDEKHSVNGIRCIKIYYNVFECLHQRYSRVAIWITVVTNRRCFQRGDPTGHPRRAKTPP